MVDYDLKPNVLLVNEDDVLIAAHFGLIREYIALKGAKANRRSTKRWFKDDQITHNTKRTQE